MLATPIPYKHPECYNQAGNLFSNCLDFLRICFAFLILLLRIPAGYGQESEGYFIKDASSQCRVWFKHTFSEDSITWSGGCVNGYAEGKGTMLGFTKGKQTCRYTGFLSMGKPNGKGVFTFWGDRKLEGNFRNGDPLFLSEELLKHLKRSIVSETDSAEMYVGDNNQKQLFYDALIPEGRVRGVIVLIPGTWTTTEYLFSSLNSFCELAYKNQLAVLALSINQRLTLTGETLKLMNTMISGAIKEYSLPGDKFVMGGWSMGGIFSMRYAEFAQEDARKTAVKPLAVFNCDGPCDLIHIYNNFKRKRDKNPGQNEPAYGMRELEKYCGGTPETAGDIYEFYSPYTHDREDGGNARFLRTTPLRIYGDVDPNWWMKNRRVDMYDMNCLDQTAMVQWLNDHGNKQAEFINAFQKGIRLEGNRHPHSWSIIDPEDCIRWILAMLNE